MTTPSTHSADVSKNRRNVNMSVAELIEAGLARAQPVRSNPVVTWPGGGQQR